MDLYSAVATTWVEETGYGITLLHVVALSTSRALIRIVETEQGPSTSKELALACQELVGQAYLLSPEPRPKALQEVVTLVIEDLDETTPPTVPKRRPTIGLASMLVTAGAVYGHEGRVFQLGGKLAPELWVTRGLYFRGSIAVLGGPRNTTDEVLVTGWALQPGIEIGYSWSIGAFRIGPLVGLCGTRYSLDFNLGGGTGNQRLAWWNVRSSISADIRWVATDHVSVVLDGGFGFYPRRDRFERDTDGSVVLTTPFVDGSVALGVVTYF